MGRVPELRFPEFSGEWREVKLGEISSLITKGTTPKYFSKNGIRYIKIENIENSKINPTKCLYIEKSTHLNELKRSILKEFDILFAIAGSLGKVAVVTPCILPANTNQALSIIRLKNKEQLNFVLQVLESPIVKKYIRKSLSVGAQPNLSLKQMNDFSFSIPSLPEQQKIADFLSAVDEKITLSQKKITRLEAYKKGMMQKLLSGEVRFPGFTDAWREVKLGEVGMFIGGGTPPTKISEYWKGDIPWLSSSDINEESITNINVSRYITKKAITNSATKLVPKNTILIVSRVGVGKVAIAPYNLCTSQDFTNIEIDKTQYDVVLMTYMIKSATKRLLQFNQGTSIKGFTTTELKKLKLNIPSLPEQQKIADFLSAIDDKLALEKERLEALKRYKHGLLQKMFV